MAWTIDRAASLLLHGLLPLLQRSTGCAQATAACKTSVITGILTCGADWAKRGVDPSMRSAHQALYPFSRWTHPQMLFSLTSFGIGLRRPIWDQETYGEVSKKKKILGCLVTGCPVGGTVDCDALGLQRPVLYKWDCELYYKNRVHRGLIQMMIPSSADSRKFISQWLLLNSYKTKSMGY